MNKLVSEHQNNTPSPWPNWGSFWKTIQQIVKGELKLQWVDASKQAADPPMTVSNGHSPASYSTLASPQPPSFAEPTAEPIPLSQVEQTPRLAVYCLGSFQVRQDDHLIEKWPDNKATLIFKYMVTHREQPIHLEVLMDLFWPGVDSQAARKNCYQAIYTLRKMLQDSLSDFTHIVCDNGCYSFNPELTVWVDSEAFLAAYQTGQKLEQAGQLEQAIAQYLAAKVLYKGHFLPKDIYEDWSANQREHFKFIHLDILDRLSQHYCQQGEFGIGIDLCHKLLSEDNCREDAHRRLMRCYLRQGQRHLALRQYQLCLEALERELDVPPMPATTELYRQILEDPAQV